MKRKASERIVRALDLWGMVELERELTGDDAAVPRMPAWTDGAPAPSVCAGRTPSGILDVWIDVETAITDSRAELIRPILRWVHVDATRHVPDKATYLLGDGSTVEVGHAEPPPAHFETVRYSYQRKQRPWTELPEPLCLRVRGAGCLMRAEDLPRVLYWRFVSYLEHR